MSATSTVEKLAEAVVELARDMPGHRPIRSAFWDDTTAWHVDGAPNSLLAYGVEAVDKIASKIPADAFTAYAVNVGMASENLPRWGVKLTEPWAKWFDAIVMKEHGGATWGEAVASAGPIPTEVPAPVAPTTEVVPVESVTPTAAVEVIDDVIDDVIDAEVVEEVPEADGIYTDVPEDVYHGDPGSISSSQARTILKPGGPALMRYAPRKEKREWDYGHVAHELILGKGSGIEVVDAPDWRTKAAKEKAAEARAAGRVPILREKFEQAERLRDAVLSHPDASVVFETGVPEQSIYAHDPETGVRLRCRPDWHTGFAFSDLKTTKDAANFEKSVREYGYHQQEAFYRDVAELAGIEIGPFVFVAVEKEPPYLTAVVELSAEDVDLGRRLNRAAIDLYAHCQRTNTWPGLPPGVRTITLPPWAYTDAEKAIDRVHNMIGELSA
ncbi:exonuclease [Gordonia phage Eyre]|uniref:Exonuclease n=1 Tax=Gordonia phage Eyre TaxID=1887646 RepID=A0A1B3AZZ2_9CAUD|nr:exonuclease VIII [Gordonia phage Eyre]AOE44323.1 exonuclease [Gordonia phage Eyre]